MSSKNTRNKNTENISKTDKKYRKSIKCRFCGSQRGLIKKYNLYICRRCFKDYAEDLGFKKYD
jgi:ribosomal protein S14